MRLRLAYPAYAVLAFAIVSTLIAFSSALSGIYNIWNLQPEYSYGFVVPGLCLFLLWRQRDELRTVPITGSWWGLPIIVLGLALRVVGSYSAVTVERYGFPVVIYGLVLAYGGPAFFRRVWSALLLLIFMIPLPEYLTSVLTVDLQLMSSVLGVAVIRAAGISVFLAGNVIDLGTMQLQVAEACSGLRYLFPLMTLAFLVAYVFRAPLWKRALVFLSSIPIAILMNGLRIGFIGITSEHWGPRAAEGVLHNFEGWLVFMLSLGVVLLVAFALTRLGPVRSTWPQAFPLLAAPPSVSSTPLRFTVTKPFVVATAIVTASAIAGFGMQPRQNTAPHREDFLGFPMSIGAWQGRPGVLDQVYLDALRLDDYVLADYRDGANAVPVNFYSAYYNSQRGARRAHSPRNCIPGGGWEVQQSGRWSIHVASVGRDIPVRRVFISLGDQKQLVYYWYQERGRLMTDDNVVKWFLFWDSLTRNRTDGALVRLVTPLPLGASVADADARLQRFMNAVVPLLGPYIPD